MLRSIGLISFLALLTAGCGGGGGTGGGASSGSSPPPQLATAGGTVSGLVGSGLILALCKPTIVGSTGGHGGTLTGCGVLSKLTIKANGAFTFDYPLPNTAGADYIDIAEQPSSPAQDCVISNNYAVVGNHDVKVYCPVTYAYATNAGDNTLSAYQVDLATGALTAIGAPTPTGKSPHAIAGFQLIAGTTDTRVLLVGNEGSNSISAYTVDVATGALSAAPGSPFAVGTDPQSLTLFGSSLFVANAGSGNVSVFGIEIPTGALVKVTGSPVAVGKSPSSIVADNANGVVYVANHGGSNNISAIDSNLKPLPGSPFPAGGNPLSLALGSWQGGSGYLYASCPDAKNPGILGFSIDPATGALSRLSGSPFPVPVTQYIATDQTGAFLYATSGASILGYAVSATGALDALPGFPIAVGVNAYSIAVDSSNKFLYVADEGAARVVGFALDASTGALKPMPGSPFPAGNHPAFISAF